MRLIDRFVAVFTLAAACLLASASPLDARGCRPSRVPNGNVNSCDTCHIIPGGPRNAFGGFLEDLIDSSSSCSKEVWNEFIAMEDSDGDGRTNGEELQDPDGTWRPGDLQPGDSLQVTNPGEFDCPEEGQDGYADTRCVDITVTGPGPENLPGQYTITATAVDDGGQDIEYTFTVDNGVNIPAIIGPQPGNSAVVSLGAGTWTITVLVNDGCEGSAEDAECSEIVEVQSPPGIGPFVRSDANSDAVVDLSDAVFTLVVLFIGTQAFDCTAAGDSNGDGVIDLSDAVYTLTFLFSGGDAPVEPHPGCGESELESDLELGCEMSPEGCF